LQSSVSSYIAADPDFGRSVLITEYDRPDDKDNDVTAQSIGLMQWLSARDSVHPAVIAAAHAAVQDAQLSPAASLDDIAQLAIFPWVKAHVRYVPESDLKTPLGHTSDFVDQQLTPPAALLSMPEPFGDCPQFSMLTAAMCQVWRIPTAYKTIAADSRTPKVFTHVYIVAQTSPGRFVPLDTSNGPGPDLEYAHPYKAKVWPNHRKTDKETMIRDRQQNRVTLRRLAGLLGDEGDDGNTDTSYYDPNAGIDTSFTGTQTGTLPPPSSTIMTGPNVTPAQLAAMQTGSPQSSSGLSTLFTNIANDATKLVGPLVQQKPYYITGANGAQVLFNPNTGSIMNANAAGVGGLAVAAAAIPSSTLLLAGAALVAVLALSGKK
jgi:hypothetical protein